MWLFALIPSVYNNIKHHTICGKHWMKDELEVPQEVQDWELTSCLFSLLLLFYDKDEIEAEHFVKCEMCFEGT